MYLQVSFLKPAQFLLVGFGFVGCLFSQPRHPKLSLELKSSKPEYAEGEVVQLELSITNLDSQLAFPLIVPGTGSNPARLLQLQIFDKANNTRILRYEEPYQPIDSGSTRLQVLAPFEQIKIPLQVFGQDSSFRAGVHHLSNPLFAGTYRFEMVYRPKGRLGDSVYWFFDSYQRPNSDRIFLPGNGISSTPCRISIYRTADTIVRFEGKPLYVREQGGLYYYFSEPVKEITTGVNCIHISNLPEKYVELSSTEYFYSHFTEDFAEYIQRFEDGDIREYRKYRDYCPDYIRTEQYNEQKQLIKHGEKMNDGRYYFATIQQPGNTFLEESICNASGTACATTTYTYGNKRRPVGKKTIMSQPCVELLLNGKTNSYKIVYLE